MYKLKKVVVGISGGVDSAVSAYLLKKQGYDVLGVYMWCYGSGDPKCRAHKDRADAVKIASHLNISFEVWDFEKEYGEKVLDYFYKEYQEGRTPNPDVVCNKEIKFGLFYQKALKLGFDYVATGHYARVLKGTPSVVILNLIQDQIPGQARNDGYLFRGSDPIKNNGYWLASGVDKTKDQSYFLYRLKEEQLKHILFPVGDLKKERVRKIAKDAKLPIWDKADSQGICFVGEVPIREFLKGKIKYKNGSVVNTKGEIIGKHTGLPFYTIGQRHGFTVDKYQGLPLYVTGKNTLKNELIVGSGVETEVNIIKINDMHFINNNFKFEILPVLDRVETRSGNSKSILNNQIFKHLKVRIRHLGELLEVINLNFDQKLKILNLKLKIPQRGVASGQSAVFYFDDVVLGGGIIMR